MKPLKQELEDRGLLFQSSNDKLFDEFDAGWKNFYCGFDPTADSLHLWNFIGFMVAIHLMRRWNKYTALTGGATGMIGDPGGKDSERTFLSEENLDNNQVAISNQITWILDNLKDFTWEKFEFDAGWKNFYCGFDPTADSLHLWNFIGFMVAIHLMRRWNKYTALTGGATGMIWDPGWKDAERTFLSEQDLDNNQKAISNQITWILNNLKDFTWEKFEFDFVNNKDFYKNMWYLDFLREVWKYITVNVMMSKDTVKKRIEDPKQSISYTEFSYMLLQGYDFAKLHKDSNMLLQIWWQDQWGNLVTWTEIIRKKYDWESYALTWPLITDATGRKFGKSEWNAIWLDKNKTSPYFIYQYFMNTSDNDVERYLKMLTLIETEEIDE